ncbi:hypothetical protein BT63DRAFT_462613 [Microthyrium microscopicum]|uniref:BTB domain-containing protein n=1 Tax=Microthyrium microscopicum TaxID=703497 RepID=A0A6A6UTQ9_9PEZI|nr:hypothetical protein BT63DRAFT_462613 [Microthyrium microscopicum]
MAQNGHHSYFNTPRGLGGIDVPCPSLKIHIENNLETAKYHDFEIKCGKELFKVHRAILCPQSGFFARSSSHLWAIRLGYGEGEDVKPIHVALTKLLIHYFYSLDYNVPSMDTLRQVNELEFETDDAGVQLLTNEVILHAWMFAVADTAEVESLKLRAAEKFHGAFRMNPQDEGIGHVIEIIYDDIPESDKRLRDIVVTVLEKQRSSVIDHCHGLFQEFPQFWTDMMAHAGDRNNGHLQSLLLNHRPPPLESEWFSGAQIWF